MPFTLEQVVPWGRTFEEYRSMFSLADADLAASILGCADGPAGFNARMRGLGRRMVSADPVYQFSADEIRRRIDETYDEVLEQARQNMDAFVWTRIRSVEELGAARMGAMAEFLADFDLGAREGRYVAAELPNLPFGDLRFDLALCSHLLFLYTDHLTLDFHLRSVEEMCRVVREVRIFPLVTLAAEHSRYAQPVAERLEGKGFKVEVVGVEYEFMRYGKQMMRVTRPA